MHLKMEPYGLALIVFSIKYAYGVVVLWFALFISYFYVDLLTCNLTFIGDASIQLMQSYDCVNHIHMDGIYNIEDAGDQRMDVYMDSSLLMIDIFITAICLILLCYVIFHNDTHAEITMLLHMDNRLFMAHFSHHSYDLKWQNSWITQKWDSAHMKVSWSIV